MRLSLLPITTSPHKECVAAVGWTSSNELYSCSHDHTIWRWSRNAEALSKVCTCSESFIDMHWYPPISQRHRGVSSGEIFAVGYSNGAFSIIGKGGREERRINAHKGAVLSLRWNIEGTALATGGGDGFVKLWSRNGMLRSNVFQNEEAVHALSWAPDSNQLVFASGKNLVIKPIQSSTKHIQWEGHQGLVVKLDWNRTNKLIISVGEEGCYKVWDCFGRLSYKSEHFQTNLASVSWCPSGEVFVIGGHNLIVLCDKTGHILSKEYVEVGTMKALAWSIDGSQLAMGCTNGTVLFGHVIHRRIEWLRLKATLENAHHIQIQDLLGEKVKNLEFQDFIINMSLGFGHLIVTTTSQCIVYPIQDWRTPHIIDVRDICMILKQCAHCFLIADFSNELQLFTYEGRKLANPCFPGLRIELLNSQNISLSKDTLAVVDCNDPKTLRLLDTDTGKEFEDVLHHTTPIMEVSLNQQGTKSDRVLMFIDSNNDLYVTPILKPSIIKLASMTTKVFWSNDAHIVAAMVDQNLVIWYYPQAVFIDEDLIKFLQIKKGRRCKGQTHEGGLQASHSGKSLPTVVRVLSDIVDISKEISLTCCSFKGKNATVHSFQATRCTIQYEDGAFVTICLSPIAFLLFEYVAANHWDHAKKLCWIFKETPLWASVAAAAMNAKNFAIAEEAYMALDEVDKVKFINHLKAQTSEVVRKAEYALFKRQSKNAESILLNAGLIYRAVKLNLRLFNWDRALEVALLHKRHVDTVLWKRSEYLLDTKQKETKEAFQSLIGQVHIDVEKIKQTISEEKDHEKNLRESTS